MRYSVQPRGQIFIKDYGFLSFAKTVGKKICKNKSKTLSSKCSEKLLDHPNQSALNALKTPSKRAIQTTAEATVISLAIKYLTELQKSQNPYNRIILKELQMSMINKYLKKHINLQRKGRRLLMI